MVAVTAVAQIGDQTQYVPNGDPDMAQAIATARDGLDGFLAKADAPPPGTSGYKVKVMFRDGQQTEHIWVTPFKHQGDRFIGIVANAPDLVKTVEAGEPARFSGADITDWGYVQNGEQLGSYTVCVLFKRMPPATVEQYRRDHGFRC